MIVDNVKEGSVLSGQCIYVNGNLKVLKKDSKRKVYICHRKSFGKVEVPFANVKNNTVIKV